VEKLRIIFIGGGIRAVPLYEYVLKRKELTMELAIFMEGYENEKKYCEQLVKMARQHNVAYIVSDIIKEDILERVQEKNADLILGGGTWRSILKRQFLTSAKYGYISMHGSGLPSYRGWCPINWYIINGEEELASRMFQLDEGIDSGPLVADKNGRVFECRIKLEDKYYGEVLEELTYKRIEVYGRMLDSLLRNEITFIPQDDKLATYTCNRNPDDGEINWSENTENTYNFIRGQSHPAPGAYSFYQNRKFHIWRASIPSNPKRYVGRIPGKTIDILPSGEVDVLTGDGILRINDISVDGKEVLPRKFLSSVRVTLGFDVQKAYRELVEGRTR
jgi:methionyl-tRNA formyltransferase